MTEPLAPAPRPAFIPEDRSLTVPRGHVVRTAWVPVFRVELACRDRMSPGDVEAAFRRRLCLAPAQRWPPPVGRWKGERFEIFDGRHEWIAAVMLGETEILVAWLEPTSTAVPNG